MYRINTVIPLSLSFPTSYNLYLNQKPLILSLTTSQDSLLVHCSEALPDVPPSRFPLDTTVATGQMIDPSGLSQALIYYLIISFFLIQDSARLEPKQSRNTSDTWHAAVTLEDEHGRVVDDHGSMICQ